MRQLWIRGSRSWLFLIVAAASALALAASSPVYSAVRGGDITGSTVRTIMRDAGTCTRATASRVATRLHVEVDPILHRTPIFQVLCGPFFGPYDGIITDPDLLKLLKQKFGPDEPKQA